jgi:hypothetical protein
MFAASNTHTSLVTKVFFVASIPLLKQPPSQRRIPHNKNTYTIAFFDILSKKAQRRRKVSAALPMFWRLCKLLRGGLVENSFKVCA